MQSSNEVAAQVAEKGFDYLDSHIVRVANKNCPVPYNFLLEQEMMPSVERIKENILKILGKI